MELKKISKILVLILFISIITKSAIADSTIASNNYIQYRINSGTWYDIGGACSNINLNDVSCTVGDEDSPLASIIDDDVEGAVDFRLKTVCEAAANDAGDAAAPTGICTGDCGGTTYSTTVASSYSINFDSDEPDCSAAGHTWFSSLGAFIGSNSQCCGDDGTSDDFATYSGTLTTSTTSDCRRCANAVDDGTTALYGNGYVSGSTCYYGDMTCTYTTATSGTTCTLAADEICVDDTGCSSCSPFQRSDTSTCYTDCSANDNADCTAGYHCDESSQCVIDLESGSACIENSDCTSDYCGSDYDDGKFCTTSSTTCVHDGTNYASGTYLNGWTCSALSDGVWNDVTPPGKITITNTDGDSSSPYWDTSDNSQTIIQLSGGESGIECRISTQNTNYDAMSSYVVCTGSPTVSCSLDLSESSSYTYYIACQDEYGNDQTGVNITSVDFGVDWSEPTTYVSGYGEYYAPGHEVTLHEDDNIGDSVTILTWHCSPTSGCSPTTAIDNLDTITFNNRGTNYLRWYSRDAAQNDQDVQEIQVEINSLPVITDSDMEALVSPPSYTGKNGGTIKFRCDGTDANRAVSGNNDYSAKIWVKTSASGTWNKLDEQAMSWDGINGYFYKEYNIADPYGTVYDMKCEITDDLGESSDHTETSVFTVLNSAPFVDDIWTNESSPSKYSWMRWYCAGADIDNPIHIEENLIATFSLTSRGDAWSLLGVENETMSWDAGSGEHYFDHYILEDGGTHYDVRCQLDDGVDTSILYVEMNATGAGNVNSTAEIQTQDDWDNDGISDAVDTVEGRGEHINTSLTVDILVDNSLVDTSSGRKNVAFRTGGKKFVEFSFDFDGGDLEAPLIYLYRQNTDKGAVIVKGLHGIRKRLSIPVVLGTDLVCAKNSEISSVSEITVGCTASDETLFMDCDEDGETIGNLNCTKIGADYVIDGMNSSGAIEFGNARLEIWMEGTSLLLDVEHFYANYTNSSSDAPITGGDCDIWFTDTGWVNMNFDGTFWNYNKTFDTSGDYGYNVSCTHATFTNLTVNDTFTIMTAAIPEFSTMTLGLGLVIILVSLILFRRRD